jgi:glucokinase
MKEYILGIDIGGTNIECALVDSKGNIKIRKSCPTETWKGSKAVLSNIISIANAVMREAKSKKHRVAAVGVGTPGAVDQKTGCVIGGAENIPGWKGIPLVPALKKEFCLPTFASNDVTLYALGEAMFGAGRGAKEIVCLALGTGIGGGIITGGRIYRGAIDGAGEVGHMTVKLDGKRCNCGSFGCLERYASATAIAEMGREACKKDRKSLLLKLAGGNVDEISARTVFDAAKKGDKTAKDITEKAGWFLGAGIANLINLLNPEMVIIGGGVAQAGGILLRIIRKAIRTYGLRINTKKVKIVLGELKSDAGVVGAAALAWQEMDKAKCTNQKSETSL